MSKGWSDGYQGIPTGTSTGWGGGAKPAPQPAAKPDPYEPERIIVQLYHEKFKEVFGDVDYTKDNRFPGVIAALIEGKRSETNIFADFRAPAEKSARGRKW